MRMLVRALSHRRLRRAGSSNQLKDHAAQPSQRRRRRRAARSGSRCCAQCHVINGINDAKLDARARRRWCRAWRPNLTHLMTRGTFAGSIYNLYTDVQSTYTGSNGHDLGTDPTDVAAAGNPGDALIGGHGRHRRRSTGSTLEAWLRNPAGDEADVRPGQDAGHAQPRPDRGADRPAGRLPRDAELIR